MQTNIECQPVHLEQGDPLRFEGDSGSGQRRSSFEEKFDELCRGAMKAPPSGLGDKCLPLREDASRQNAQSDPNIDGKKKRLRFALCEDSGSPSSPSEIMPAVKSNTRSVSGPLTTTSTQHSSNAEHSLPVPKMRNMNIAHLLNPRNRR